MRPYVVTYEDTDLHLSAEEYVELRNLAYDDPVEADRMCREFLRREQSTSEGEGA